MADEGKVADEYARLFLEKGVAITVEHDKTLATLFTGVIAGLVAVLLNKEVPLWAGATLLLAEGFAVHGLGCCLAHMAFTSKVLLLAGSQAIGEEAVSHPVRGELPITHVLQQQRKYMLGMYTGQLAFLFLSVLSASIGVSILLWDQAKAAGVLATVFVVVVVLALMIRGVGLQRQQSRNIGDTDSE